MEAAVERRDVDENRVPLDSPIELSHEGFAESFEADAVNVSAGGLSMRASYLPSVGARLRCRIPCAPAGSHIEAGAEVVWSADKGPHTGEFGLRFLDIDDDSAKAIGAMLSRGPLGVAGYLPPAPKGVPGAEDTLDEARLPESISLGIDGISEPIRAKVVAEDPDVLTVSQELSFLRLATAVTVRDSGRRGRIEGIELLVDGDTPRLLIDILFEETAVEVLAVKAADATIPDFMPRGQELGHEPAEAHPAAPDDEPGHDVHTTPTVVDVSSPPAREIEEAPKGVLVEAEPRSAHAETIDAAEAANNTGLADLAEEAEADLAAFAATVPEPDALEMRHEKALARITGVAIQVMATLRTWARLVGPGVARARGKFGPLVGSLRAKFGPAVSGLRAKLASHTATLRSKVAALFFDVLPRVGASIKQTGRVLVSAVHLVRDKVGHKIPALARREKRRRKTAPPPTDSNVARRRSTRRQTTAAAAPKKDRRRTMVVSAFAFSAVALAVWALTPGGDTADAADPLQGHQSIVAQPASSPEAGALVPTAPVAAALVAEGSAPSPVAAAPVVGEPAMPRALGEASREAGPMPAPTFPSLSEGARPQAPQGLPEGSPYAVDVREGAAPAAPPGVASEGTVFGASDVDNGRSYLIRMSQPVTVVRGTARADGFTIEIPSSLSLDRAGPIAASHPLVERSMILNRGDHSELTISFVSGHSPAYRVSARGSAIEVLIARR